MRLRVAVVAPFTFPSVRGNAVTVDRITRGLRERGVDLRVWDASATPAAVIEREVAAARPSLVHAFHAYRVGPLALRLARRAEIPLVVTMTGTDANHDLLHPERAPVVRRVLEGAAAVVVFHESIAARVGALLPDVAGRLHVVPQAAAFPKPEPFDLAARWPLPPDRVLFVLPAGLRPVKRPRLPLGPLGRVAARRPQLRLLYVGPVLDPREGEALLQALDGVAWARYLGPVAHAQMPSVLRESDVVLNCSLSEGGMANSVLEALALGRAVLAADIEGNRSLIEDGVTGLLFRNEAEFEARAEALVADPALRRRLGAAGRALVERRYPSGREVEGYLALYRSLTPVRAT
ncbi:MAG TPA: glycosyltransferase [Candidatus Binatia bacterium]|nr:glycosyltransferase [Candidatus Binatia bacterium]